MKKLLVLLSACLCVNACHSTDPSMDADNRSLSQKLITLETKLDGAAGIRAIKRLQYAYAQYLSAGLWDHAALLFTNNAQAYFGDQAVSGRENIADYLSAEFGNGPNRMDYGDLNEHFIMSPVINITGDGNQALGRWRLVALRGKYKQSAEWLGGIFENTYLKENGIWKISEFRYFPIYAGNYTDGWRNIKEETQEDVKPIPYHYTADEAGIPNPVTWADNKAQERVAGSISQDTLNKLDRKARQLLDEDAILNLQNSYGYYLDRQMWDDLADLFHSEGTLELGHSGVYKGKENIRRALDQLGPQGLPANEVNDHLQLQTVVTVAGNGLTANARGTELQLLGLHEQNSQWGIGVFDNAYIKVNGTWQIKSVHVYTRMLTDYAKGWAVDAQPAPLANPEFQADAPISQPYFAYPEFFVPDFHYPNPGLPLSEAKKEDSVLDSKTGDPGSSSIEARIAELERNLRVLDAYDGAENVSNAYGYYIDEFSWDGMADLFSEGGWKELSYIGAYVGRERVRNSVVSRYGRDGRQANGRTFHQKTQPVITVSKDGYSARIRTRLFQLNSSTFNPGSYISGIYENQIVIENGIWKISGMDLDYAWLADYAGGWEKVVPGSSNRFAPPPGSLTGDNAPDRPLRGVTFAPYPEGPVDMAFSYLNPVSGRKPPIYLPEVNYGQLTFEKPLMSK